jgi:hypothetical protein
MAAGRPASRESKLFGLRLLGTTPNEEVRTTVSVLLRSRGLGRSSVQPRDSESRRLAICIAGGESQGSAQATLELFLLPAPLPDEKNNDAKIFAFDSRHHCRNNHRRRNGGTRVRRQWQYSQNINTQGRLYYRRMVDQIDRCRDNAMMRCPPCPLHRGSYDQPFGYSIRVR